VQIYNTQYNGGNPNSAALIMFISRNKQDKVTLLSCGNVLYF